MARSVTKQRHREGLARARPAPVAPALARAPVLGGAALIMAAVAIAYLPAMHGAFILDDVPLLSDNRMIRAPDGLYRIWFTSEPVDYWPVFNSSLWLEWRLWGTNTIGYHLTSAALHGIACLLLWAVLRRLAVPGAFVAALLFAVHPVNVETVAWITQRKSLLAMIFALLSVLCYLRPEPRVGERRQGPPPIDRWYWLSLAAFALAMLSKGSVAPLPAVLLLLVWWLRPLAARDVLRVLPFVIVAAALAVVTMAFQARFMGAVPASGIAERALRAGAVVWFYLWKALAPVNLAFVYPRWDIRPDDVRWWVPFLAAAAVTIALWLARRTWGRPLWFAWACFGLALAPAMGFTDATFMEHSLVADHYQHLALVAVVALAAAAWATRRQLARDAPRRLLDGLAVAAVGACIILTWTQSALYADGATLFEDTLAKNPGSAFAHNALAIELAGDGDTSAALAHWEHALRLKPAYPEAHYNIARTLFDAGQYDAALAHFEETLRLRPAHAGAHYDLGTALARTHRVELAIEHLQAAVRLDPSYANAHNNLANLLVEAGRRDEAIEHYRRAVELDPNLAEAHLNFGTALYQTGRREEAVAHWTEALRLRPDYAEAHTALGVAFTEAGALPQAIEHLQEAVRLRPDDPIARANLEEVAGKRAPDSSPQRHRVTENPLK